MAFSTVVLATASLASFKNLTAYIQDKHSFFHGFVIIASQGFRIMAYITLLSYCPFALVVVLLIWLNNVYYLNRSELFKDSPLVLVINSLLNVPLICLFRRESLVSRQTSRENIKDQPPPYERGLMSDEEANKQRLDQATQSESEIQEAQTTAMVNKLIKASNSWLMLTILIVTVFVFIGTIVLPCDTLLAQNGGPDFGYVSSCPILQWSSCKM